MRGCRVVGGAWTQQLAGLRQRAQLFVERPASPAFRASSDFPAHASSRTAVPTAQSSPAVTAWSEGRTGARRLTTATVPAWPAICPSWLARSYLAAALGGCWLGGWVGGWVLVAGWLGGCCLGGPAGWAGWLAACLPGCMAGGWGGGWVGGRRRQTDGRTDGARAGRRAHGCSHRSRFYEQIYMWIYRVYE